MPCVDHQQPNGNQYRGKPNTEGNNQQQSEAYTLQSNRTQQHYQRCRAGNNPSRDPQREQLSEGHRLSRLRVVVRVRAVGMDMRLVRGQVMVVRVVVGMRMPVRVAVRVGMCMSMGMRVAVRRRCLTSGVAPEKQRTAYPGNGQARKHTQPWVEALRDDIA
jgi:hypothetical protein